MCWDYPRIKWKKKKKKVLRHHNVGSTGSCRFSMFMMFSHVLIHRHSSLCRRLLFILNSNSFLMFFGNWMRNLESEFVSQTPGEPGTVAYGPPSQQMQYSQPPPQYGAQHGGVPYGAPGAQHGGVAYGQPQSQPQYVDQFGNPLTAAQVMPSSISVMSHAEP